MPIENNLAVVSMTGGRKRIIISLPGGLEDPVNGITSDPIDDFISNDNSTPHPLAELIKQPEHGPNWLLFSKRNKS